MITRLNLKNISSFNELHIEFSPKINVIIGENGTGKTQLLKAVYGLYAGATVYEADADTTDKQLAEVISRKLVRLFMPLDGKLGRIRRHGVAENAALSAEFSGGQHIGVSFHTNSKTVVLHENVNYNQQLAKAVFIPTKEVLSLVRGMTDAGHDQKTVELIFDSAYVDLADFMLLGGHEDFDSKVSLDPRIGSIIPKLTNLIGGRYRFLNGGFNFEPGSYEEKVAPTRGRSKSALAYQDSTVTEFVRSSDPVLSSGMTAEGFRKIGVLQRLLSNGTINPGVSGALIWDEPESNLNPKLMKQLVESLLELARNGQQIILATHDYVMLKWFDLLMDEGKGDHVRFHALYRDKDTASVAVSSVDDYRAILPNSISDTFTDLTKEQVSQKMGRLGK
ncbi:AAA family ATPase [Halopseudomonas sp.]|uniref:AAA family ATPase n=1 Tax=Halopseudomonas sp. TaxID=2901191 RepID=UPI0039E2575A